MIIEKAQRERKRDSRTSFRNCSTREHTHTTLSEHAGNVCKHKEIGVRIQCELTRSITQIKSGCTMYTTGVLNTHTHTQLYSWQWLWIQSNNNENIERAKHFPFALSLFSHPHTRFFQIASSWKWHTILKLLQIFTRIRMSCLVFITIRII